MKKAIALFLFMTMMLVPVAASECGDGFLCCPGEDGYYVETAICANGQIVSCILVECPPDLVCIPSQFGCIWVPRDWFE